MHSAETNPEVMLQDRAFLLHDATKIPIHAVFASKYSIAFTFLDEPQGLDEDKPISLLFQNGEQAIELGPCRILPEPDIDGYSGQLVFLRDVYNVEDLLVRKRITRLQDTSDPLLHALERKRHVKQSFKDFTTELAYDLSVYKSFFDRLDSEYVDEPHGVKKSIQKAILDSEGPQFDHFFHERVEDLKRQVGEFSREEHQNHGYYFRRQLWNFILCCPLMARTNLKPRGYAGDSEMMRMIYEKEYEGASTFSRLMQKYTLETPAAQSVRNRRELVKRALGEYQLEHSGGNGERIRVLSVACGPAFELRDILASGADFRKYHFTLLDQDSMALNEASELVSGVERGHGLKAEVAYVQASVRFLLRNRLLKENKQRFHFIYSMGLFDYLSFPVAKALIERLFLLLEPGGEMLIGNFHVSNPSRYFMEYWGDWYLIHRTEEELMALLEDISPGFVTIFYEKARSQMFLRLRR
jgi:extracellular factor (EF) 3-hydroxypalmitic acid methyl ester biosynthesis protein